VGRAGMTERGRIKKEKGEVIDMTRYQKYLLLALLRRF
jgi:hypothetical protein